MAEWVDYGSLKGPQGDKGDTGDQGPQGAKGDTGAQGPKGDTGATPVITMTATVDANVGTPSVNVQQGGTAENPTFSLAFANIKGEKGDKGDTGDQGPQGEQGPQGPKGDDATLPEGGTDGQVLTKTADGEAWEDVPAPDMTGVVKTDATGSITSGGSMTTFGVQDSSSALNYAKFRSMNGGRVSLSTNTGVSGLEISSSSGNMISISVANSSGETVTIGPKSIHSITDSISASPAGNALTTDKAVVNYINSLIATDEEFDTFFGLG